MKADDSKKNSSKDNAAKMTSPSSSSSSSGNNDGDAPPMDGNLMGPELIRGLQPLALAKHFIFSSTRPVPVAAPSSRGKTQALRLVSIANSSYAEKARWALDLACANDTSPYYWTDDVHPPALHCIFSLPVSKNTQSRTPMVVFEGNNNSSNDNDTPHPPILSSDEIVRFFCPHLYPPAIAKEICALEQDLGQRLGATARSIYYCHNMMPPHARGRQYYPAIVKLCTCGPVTAVERFLFANMLDKGVDQGIWECLQLTPQRNVVAEKILRQTLAELSQHVVERNLLDDSCDRHWMDTATQRFGFTAADLCIATFVASMTGDIPALQGWSASVLQDSDLPPTLMALRRDSRNTPIAAFAKRMYQKYRPVGPDGRIVVRPARQGVNPLRSRTLWSVVTAMIAVGVLAWSRRT